MPGLLPNGLVDFGLSCKKRCRSLFGDALRFSVIRFHRDLAFELVHRMTFFFGDDAPPLPCRLRRVFGNDRFCGQSVSMPGSGRCQLAAFQRLSIGLRSDSSASLLRSGFPVLCCRAFRGTRNTSEFFSKESLFMVSSDREAATGFLWRNRKRPVRGRIGVGRASKQCIRCKNCGKEETRRSGN